MRIKKTTLTSKETINFLKELSALYESYGLSIYSGDTPAEDLWTMLTFNVQEEIKKIDELIKMLEEEE